MFRLIAAAVATLCLGLLLACSLPSNEGVVAAQSPVRPAATTSTEVPGSCGYLQNERPTILPLTAGQVKRAATLDSVQMCTVVSGDKYEVRFVAEGYGGSAWVKVSVWPGSDFGRQVYNLEADGYELVSTRTLVSGRSKGAHMGVAVLAHGDHCFRITVHISGRQNNDEVARTVAGYIAA